MGVGVNVQRCVRAPQAAPARLVLVQVVQHSLAEQAGLGEAMPFLKQRFHDVGDETYNTKDAF